MTVARDLALGEADGPMVRAVRARYSEPQRRYHDWSHVEALSRGFAATRGLFTDVRAAALAILYHDAIYDPKSRTNEADSSDLLLAERTGLEAPGTLLAADAMIRATAEHRVPDGLSAERADDCAAFLDLDMGILAAPPDEYDRYVRRVRTEYAHVTDEAWRAGRARLLRGFLGRERIYITGELHRRWDQRARANLRRELAALR